MEILNALGHGLERSPTNALIVEFLLRELPLRQNLRLMYLQGSDWPIRT